MNYEHLHTKYVFLCLWLTDIKKGKSVNCLKRIPHIPEKWKEDTRCQNNFLFCNYLNVLIYFDIFFLFLYIYMKL